MARKVTLIAGDGIGPEVVEAARRCIDATGVRIEWEEAAAGEPAQKKNRETNPQESIESTL